MSITDRPRRERICDGKSKAHHDAQKVIEYLISHGGSTSKPYPEIARELGFVSEMGHHMFRPNTGRMHRAVNHARDMVDDLGRPCCTYAVHYRSVGGQSSLSIMDETGEYGSHAPAVVALLHGDLSRMRQHHTENTRRVENWDELASWCFRRADEVGYKLCHRAIIEIQTAGTITDPTIAELNAWLESIS